jgi:Tol biopolymer transport system component
MKQTNLLVMVVLVALPLLGVACGAKTTSQPVILPTETAAFVTPTETQTPAPSLTPTPEPTNTPTLVPTPIGGKNGLLLHQSICPQSGVCIQTIFLYNLVSHELTSILDGYVPIDVSPDGKKVILMKDPWKAGDLFILDLSQPDQITLLQENVREAAWLGDSDWIGFISISAANARRQVFIIHPDGSGLKQVTNTSLGAVALAPVFNDGVFWGEGTISSNGSKYIQKSIWTNLDGTETAETQHYEVFPSGRSMMAFSRSPDPACWGCKFDLVDVATSSKKTVTLLPPANHVLDLVMPLSDDRWLAVEFTTSNSVERFWIYSADGSILAELPTEYRIANDSDPPTIYDLLSPDGNWIIVSNYEKTSDGQTKGVYHLFNVSTSEIIDLPNLYNISIGEKIVGNRRVDGEIEGCRVNKYFWVEMP